MAFKEQSLIEFFDAFKETRIVLVTHLPRPPFDALAAWFPPPRAL
jgi:hypothetical protein